MLLVGLSEGSMCSRIFIKLRALLVILPTYFFWRVSGRDISGNLRPVRGGGEEEVSGEGWRKGGRGFVVYCKLLLTYKIVLKTHRQERQKRLGQTNKKTDRQHNTVQYSSSAA